VSNLPDSFAVTLLFSAELRQQHGFAASLPDFAARARVSGQPSCRRDL